jgi:hypothetical protein
MKELIHNSQFRIHNSIPYSLPLGAGIRHNLVLARTDVLIRIPGPR